MYDHARCIHDHETDVRRIYDNVAHSALFVLLFYLSIAEFDKLCFGVLKFQSTSHVLLFSTSTVFYFVLVSMGYLIYFHMLPKKIYLVVKSEIIKRNEELIKT